MNKGSLTSIYLYGPSGSGKSMIGRMLAAQLSLPFIDLDEQIATAAQKSIAQIFASEGEAGFRARESAALEEITGSKTQVISLGGGALLSPANRQLALASGQILCLNASLETLVGRLAVDEGVRPLLLEPAPDQSFDRSDSAEPHRSAHHQKADALRASLARLLEARSAHYASFPLQLCMDELTPEEAVWQAQVCLGMFRVTGMDEAYDVRVHSGGLDQLGSLLFERNLRGPVAMISDSNVAGLYGDRVRESLLAAGYSTTVHVIPAGEAYKTIATAQELWSSFLHSGLERSSTVVSLGGGVVGDLTGFAAATYLRGIRWVGIPTTLLSIVDASLGGKTGIDLPQGKNLVGAFHPPAFVLADPQVLHTLPPSELRSGLAEVVKHGVIGDPQLFEICAQGLETIQANLEEVVRRAMAVKIQIIEQDPYEQSRRAALNLGHTLGHALELASDFTLHHGEAVAIGMVAAARLSERWGEAEPGLAQCISSTLSTLGLPVEIPSELDLGQILAAIGYDKKRHAGSVRLALPIRIGEVRVGVRLDDPEDLLLVKH
ncbi:MAG: aroK aroB [Chloroflexi bacterium]|nr:aroK aroB [Chloroflexota bacterium]